MTVVAVTTSFHARYATQSCGLPPFEPMALHKAVPTILHEPKSRVGAFNRRRPVVSTTHYGSAWRQQELCRRCDDELSNTEAQLKQHIALSSQMLRRCAAAAKNVLALFAAKRHI